MKSIYLIIATLVFTLGGMAQAQQQKHPRVAELEAQLTRQAIEILRSRFPDKPFLATVNIDALHRYGEGQARGGVKTDQERLPLSWYDDEEIRDEWDDPKMPLSGLLSRVKKAVVNVSLTSDTSEDEVAEVQQSLMLALNLVPARDEVKIQRRSWTLKPPLVEPLYLWLGAAALSLAFGGLFGIFYFSARRISKAIKEAGGKSVTTVSGGGPAPVRSMGIEKQEGPKLGGGASGDVRFNDPLKTREVILNAIQALLEQHRDVFPSLQDMILLDRFGEENPSALGALLLEFPMEQQRALFSRSFRNHWLNALNDPGELGSACLEMLQKLVRNARHESSHAWEEMMIAVWRLDDQRAEFIRSLDQDEAFSILAHMPKSMAVSVARVAFPGGWGVVLDDKFKPKEIATDRLEKLTKKALAIAPLREYSVLDRYKQEKDLLDYLKTVEPSEEREIYTVTPADSIIHSMRAPFYSVLDLNPEAMQKIVHQVSLDDWALSMLNVPKAERRALDRALSDKQRFLYLEHLKHLESMAPDMRQVGAARERIANTVNRLLKTQAQHESTTGSGDESVESKSAA